MSRSGTSAIRALEIRALGMRALVLRALGISALGMGLAAAAACTSGPPPPPDDTSREAAVLAERAAKDRMFRTSAASPLLPDQRTAFSGLPYFPFDASYRIPASLVQEPDSTGRVIELTTSGDELRRMRRVGTLKFVLGGAALQLTAFADANARTVDELFVPFGDLTNGVDTYQGGRYLELRRTPTGLYDLDFNLAYHPYCVFNPAYICPVPPRENRLEVPIRAGEKLKSPA
jgi:uncharacterized protein (DUF1684 family)